MNYTDIMVAFLTGIITSIIPRFFRSKKEQDVFLLELIQVMRGEIDRMHRELKEVREEYDKKLSQMQHEYDKLLAKYTALKQELDTYKNKRS